MASDSRAYSLPDLDLSPSIPCGAPECFGDVSGDGTSWWCETCGGTWDSHGMRGEREPTAGNPEPEVTARDVNNALASGMAERFGSASPDEVTR